jgi:hypothetical protein
MSTNAKQAQQYEVRSTDLEYVLTLDKYPCIYDHMDEAQDAAEMLGGRVAVLLTDGTYLYL